VQIAVFSERISYLQAHVKSHHKDYSVKRALTQLVDDRRKMLRYLKRTSQERCACSHFFSPSTPPSYSRIYAYTAPRMLLISINKAQTLKHTTFEMQLQPSRLMHVIHPRTRTDITSHAKNLKPHFHTCTTLSLSLSVRNMGEKHSEWTDDTTRISKHACQACLPSMLGSKNHVKTVRLLEHQFSSSSIYDHTLDVNMITRYVHIHACIHA
jgi:hypothetical protein